MADEFTTQRWYDNPEDTGLIGDSPIPVLGTSSGASDKWAKLSAIRTWILGQFSSAVQALLGAADVSAARTALGVDPAQLGVVTYTSSATVGATDRIIRMNCAADANLTITAGLTQPYIEVWNDGEDPVTLVADTGVTIDPAGTYSTLVISPKGAASARNFGGNEWRVVGLLEFA